MNNCSPDADAGLMLLSCIKVNTSPNTYFTPSLGWPKSSLYKVNTFCSPTPAEETGYFLVNLYVSNFHINITKVMIWGFLGLLYFPTHSHSY